MPVEESAIGLEVQAAARCLDRWELDQLPGRAGAEANAAIEHVKSFIASVGGWVPDQAACSLAALDAAGAKNVSPASFIIRLRCSEYGDL